MIYQLIDEESKTVAQFEAASFDPGVGDVFDIDLSESQRVLLVTERRFIMTIGNDKVPNFTVCQLHCMDYSEE